MNTNRNLCGLLSTLLLLLTAVPSFAGSQNAVVYGTVYDAAGNPKGGVTVKIVDPDMGLSRTTTSASDGTFSFAEVPPSEEYRVIATVEGRVIDFRGGVSVNVGDEMVVLPPLREQSVAATGKVEKRVGTAGVRNETVSTSISGVITGDQLRALPLYNRTFLALGLLMPNVRDVEAGSEIAGASYSISGSRTSSNNFLLDGADNVASGSNQAIPFQVNDSIQEFRVVSSTASAEYGRNSGGVVNVVTRRAGNAFHGSVYGYFANDALNADSPLSVYNSTTFDRAAAYAGPLDAQPLPVAFFAPASPLTYNHYAATAEDNARCTDPASIAVSFFCFSGNRRFDPAAVLEAHDRRKRSFDSMQFGANLGGAFVKDTWFGFASYEGTRIDSPNPLFERVPSAFDRTYDPYGSGLFQFALTSPDYVFARDVLSLFPAANVAAIPDVLEFFRGEAPNYINVHNLLFRTDVRKSESASWSVRYVVQDLNQLHDATLPPQPNYPGNGAFRDALNQNLSGTYTQAFSASLINEARVGFSRFNVTETPQDTTFDATALGEPGFNLPGQALPTILLNGLDTQYSFALAGVFDGTFAGWSGRRFSTNMNPTLDYQFPYVRLGAPLTVPSQRRDGTLFFSDHLTGTLRSHNWKAGVEARYLSNHVIQRGFSRGLMYSSNIGEFTSDSEGCNLRCDDLFGISDAFQRPSFDFFHTQQPYVGDFRSWALAGYFQDSWRLHPRWTVNLGLRYEFFQVPRETENHIWNFDPRANGLVRAGASQVEDPYGNPCGALGLPQFVPAASAPAWSVAGGIRVIPGPWKCQTAGTFSLGRSDRNNFGPRIGLAWDLFGDGRTVLRGGIGWFFDHQPTSQFAPLLFNRPTASPNALYGQISFINFAGNLCLRPIPSFRMCPVGNSIVNPAVQAAISPDGVNPNAFYSAAQQPFAIYARDVANSLTPRTRQISVTVQQAITDRFALEVGYVGTDGNMLPVVFNSNYQNEFTVFQYNTLTFTPNQTAGNLVFFPMYTLTHRGDSSFRSMMVRVRVADWHGLRLSLAYSLSSSQDNASNAFFPTLPITLHGFGEGYQRGVTTNPTNLCLIGTAPAACSATPLVFPSIDFSSTAVTTTGANPVLVSRYSTPQDPFNFLRDDVGRSDFHTKHRLALDYTWELPLWKQSRWMSNWQISGVFVAQSGQPFTIFAGPILGEVTQRANVTGPVQVTDNPQGAIAATNLGLPLLDCIDQILPLPGFVSPMLPTPGTACTGNSRRNAFTGPNFLNFDFALQKGFALGEGKRLNFRAEFYNLTNRRNFYNPISALSTDGANLNPDFGKIKSAHDPRQIQFAVRFTW